MPEASRLNDTSFCPSDTHGEECCPHSVAGPAIEGSDDVHINDLPALRRDDRGVHAQCCGANTWKTDECSGTVLINGRGAVRKGDRTIHCGGPGTMTEGSANVYIGG